MPFQTLTDRPLPELLYLDAGALLRALYSRHQDNAAMVRLIQDGAASPTRMHTSQVIFPELNDAYLKLVLERAGADVGACLRDPNIIHDSIWEKVFEFSKALEDLVGTAGIITLKADGPTRESAYVVQRKYKIRAFDSIHLASCQRKGISDMVCFDSDFHPVPGLTVWTAAKLIPPA